MFMKSKMVGAIVMATAFFGSAEAAPKKAPNHGDAIASTKFPEASATEAMQLANKLIRFGYTNNDALALITGARIKQGAGGTEAKPERVGAGTPEAKAGTDMLSVAAALAKAKELAGSRTDLIALIDETGKAGNRGAVGGPKHTDTVVSRGATDVFRVTFRGGEPARVLASGDGDSDLDLYVLDENGNEVCRDDDASDDMICSWTPKWTGTFVLKIKNRGMANRYQLYTN